ncbi:hypothetical protein EI969_19170 [Pseudomonas sp. PB101]|nr:hypothetical protein [Pseudomonas sp. PB101]
MPDPLPGNAMFHRHCPLQAQDPHCTALPVRLPNRKLKLRQLFISGVVAACDMEVLLTLLPKRCLCRHCPFDKCDQSI